jgi:hypothetical protein
VSFLETDTELLAITQKNGQESHDHAEIYRFSFLPGRLFSQRFVPLLLNWAGEMRPALLVDNSNVYSSTTFIWTVNSEGQLKLPAGLSFEVPQGCDVLNPARTQKGTDLVMMCEKNSKLFYQPLAGP